MPLPPDVVAACDAAKAKVRECMEGTSAPDLEAAMKDAQASIDAAAAARKGKGKPDALEEEIKALLNDASEKASELAAAAKAAKDAARKALQAEAAKAASPLLASKEELQRCLDEATAVGLPDKELNAPREALTLIISFHYKLTEAAKALKKAAEGRALELNIKQLEDDIAAVRDDAHLQLRKYELSLWLEVLTKPAGTQVCTEELDKALEEAKLILAETEWKPKKKKCEEAKKAQNAKKVAERKAKKPISDPPPPPDKPEYDELVAKLQAEMLEAFEVAQAKLSESQTTVEMEKASQPDLLKIDKLLDLGERPADEAHPTVQALEDAIKKATDCKARAAPEPDRTPRPLAALARRAHHRDARARRPVRTLPCASSRAPPPTSLPRCVRARAPAGGGGAGGQGAGGARQGEAGPPECAYRQGALPHDRGRHGERGHVRRGRAHQADRHRQGGVGARGDCQGGGGQARALVGGSRATRTTPVGCAAPSAARAAPRGQH